MPGPKKGCGGRPKTEMTKRFWSNVQKTESCWLWVGYTRGGYGAIGLPGGNAGMTPAHRYSWEIHNGDIPDGLMVCHNCPGGDNPLCVNPAHLFLGTCKDNLEDAADKGRMHQPKGELNHQCVLTETSVRHIRSMAGKVSRASIAKMFGVSVNHIGAIIRREKWNHI